MMTPEERRKLVRRISDSDMPRTILRAILLIVFLHLVFNLVELVDKLEAKFSASSRALGVRP